ncbi:hypothetical protein ANCCAN_08924 [Ancylostoma caninum]|uniref:Uncharacterized protein n=1 Tax=Ancylostoma caninum TaxID=29170 RepID=A0A368GP48_ANCCA|nr:hypothetical protein ANCCAN_08924 [Ancylostoma caninum]
MCAQSDPVLRDYSSYIEDGRLGRLSIPKETAIMRLISPRAFPGDALHICSEGLTQDLRCNFFLLF